MKKYLFPLLIAISALVVSITAAFYSVTGLSKLFAGAATAVIIMASGLEFAKLVIASLLHQYWKTINKLLKIYLSVALVTLILITSAGIYGFLSAAYQETANKGAIVDTQVEFLEKKKASFEKIKTGYDEEKSNITTSIKTLRDALGNNVLTYVDANGNTISYSSSANRRTYEKQLEQASAKEEQLTAKIQTLNDSILNLETQILTVSNNSELAAELGPLKYLAQLTNRPMDKIINYFILTLIFVFDPLAISLVLAANFAFAKLKPEENNDSDIDSKVEPEEPYTEHKEFDEDHALDLVLNDVVEDLEVEEELEEASLVDLQNIEPYQIYVTGSKPQEEDWVIESEPAEEPEPESRQVTPEEHLELEIARIKKNSNISSWKKQQLIDAAKKEYKRATGKL